MRAEVPAFRASVEHFARASGILLIEGKNGEYRVASGRQKFYYLKNSGATTIEAELVRTNGVRRQVRLNIAAVSFP